MKTQNVITNDQEQLARFAKALSHPVRVYIMDLLAGQDCCFSGDLAEVLPIARSTLSQHLKELKNAGLIHGNIEYPKIRYCINPFYHNRARELFNDFFNQNT